MTSFWTWLMRLVGAEMPNVQPPLFPPGDNAPPIPIPPAIPPQPMKFVISYIYTMITSMFGSPDVSIPTRSITRLIYRTVVGVFIAIIVIEMSG